MTDWQPVARALLGSWPTAVAGWGRDALAAYIEMLEARAVTPEQALQAILRSDGAFPPSAAELAKTARQDPDQPTPDEMLAELYEPGGVFGVKRSSVVVSPWTLAFVGWFGRERLRLAPVDGDYGSVERKRIMDAYVRFVEANEGRAVAAIASGRRAEGLARLDPRSFLGEGPPRQLGSGSGQ